MELFFDPRSVVVIGASNTPFNLGHTICNMLNNDISSTKANLRISRMDNPPTTP